MKLSPFSNDFELSPTLAANETVLSLRKQGKTITHMGFGQAPFPVPEKLKSALMKASGNNRYLPTLGLEELRQAILEYYQNKTGLNAEHYDVVIAPGSKLILYSVQMAVQGDLLMPVPSWVSYAPQAIMLGTDVIKVPTMLDDAGYHLSALDLKKTIDEARKKGLHPTKLILNAPNNPTGLTIPEEDLKEIAALCLAEDILIISDEIYGFLDFNGHYCSISKYAPSHTVISSGLSKHISLGGWRIGFGLIPKSIKGLTPLLSNIASETWSCVPSPIQEAVIEVFKNHDDIENFINDSRILHRFINTRIAQALRDHGVLCPLPQGAFYLYPNFEPFRKKLEQYNIFTSKDLADHLLQKYGLVSLPGHAFGEKPETLTLRLSGCDYDGAKVLEAYRSAQTLDDIFLEENAPNILGAVKIFKDFIASL